MGVQVEGVADTAHSLTQAAADLGDADLDTLAADAARVVMGFIPVRTGRARATVQGTASNGRAVVTIGGPRVTYTRFIKRRFAERTDTVMETRAVQHLEDEWNTIAERHGLT